MKNIDRASETCVNYIKNSDMDISLESKKKRKRLSLKGA